MSAQVPLRLNLHSKTVFLAGPKADCFVFLDYLPWEVGKSI